MFFGVMGEACKLNVRLSRVGTYRYLYQCICGDIGDAKINNDM